MITPQTLAGRGARGRKILANWGPTILFNVALPLLTYFILTDRGVSAVPALLASGGWPVIDLGLTVAVRRRLDEFAILTLIFIALGVVTGLGFNSARLILVKESIVTGLFGLVTLGSLTLSRPLMFYFGRKFATDGSVEAIANWNSLWQYPSFRRVQRVITVVWGVVFVAEALLRIALSYALSTSAMKVLSTIMPLAVTGSLVAWTYSYGRRAKAAAAAARTSAGPTGSTQTGSTQTGRTQTSAEETSAEETSAAGG